MGYLTGPEPYSMKNGRKDAMNQKLPERKKKILPRITTYFGAN